MSQKSAKPRLSAGLLLYRYQSGVLQFLLAHPGGPLFQNKDDGAWTIPKGEPDGTEELLLTAQRELTEETGIRAVGQFIRLTPIQQKGGKWVHAWAVAQDCDPSTIKSNTFTMEWPPRSGKQQEFPEVDRAAYFDLETAKRKIRDRQAPLLDELVAILAGR